MGIFVSIAPQLQGMGGREVMTVEKSTPVAHVQRSLGRRIRDLRSKRGWTQEQFAEFCGVHRTYMGHVERGEKNVSLSTVLRVANALGVRIPTLFGGPAGAATPTAGRPVSESRSERSGRGFRGIEGGP